MKNFISGFILGFGYAMMWTTFMLGTVIMIAGCFIYVIASSLDLNGELENNE